MITAVEFRRHLHRNPELSFEEMQSAKYIEQCLDKAGISHSRIAKTGVLAMRECEMPASSRHFSIYCAVCTSLNESSGWRCRYLRNSTAVIIVL